MIKWQTHDRVGYYKGAQKPVISRVKEPQGHPFIWPFVGTVYLTPFITSVSLIGFGWFWRIAGHHRSLWVWTNKAQSRRFFCYTFGGYIPSQKKAKLENDDFQISKHMFLHFPVNWLPANQVFFGGLYSHFLIHASTSDPVYPRDPLLLGAL